MFLQINNLEKFYGEKDNRVQVLKGLSTGIGKGEICVLLGPSGSGKSTLLNIIGGIESYDKGEDHHQRCCHVCHERKADDALPT